MPEGKGSAPTPTLILAGGTIKSGERAAWNSYLPDVSSNRALASFGGKPMLSWVVDALATARIGRLLVAGDVPTPPGALAVEGGASLLDTLLNGVAALAPDETRLLVVTADIPFLTSEAVRDLLENAPDADFVYCVIDAGVCEARFPGMKRTTLTVRDGTFTGGNVVLLKPAFLRTNEGLVRAAYARRKNPFALATLLGPQIIARFLLSRLFPQTLAISHLEAAVSRALGGADVAAYVTSFPEIGADIDRPEEIDGAIRYLEVES